MSKPDEGEQGLALGVAKTLLDTELLPDKRAHLARVLGLLETVNVMIWASLIEDGTLEEHQKIPMFTELHSLFVDRVQEGMISYLTIPPGRRPKL